MKLLKAYIRSARAEHVVRALEQAGAPGITVVAVHGVGYGYDPRSFQPPTHIGSAPMVMKIEIVCHDDEVDALLNAILTNAQTGSSGDGIVFVTPVDRAVKIRTGEEHLAHLRESLQGT